MPTRTAQVRGWGRGGLPVCVQGKLGRGGRPAPGTTGKLAVPRHEGPLGVDPYTLPLAAQIPDSA